MKFILIIVFLLSISSSSTGQDRNSILPIHDLPGNMLSGLENGSIGVQLDIIRIETGILYASGDVLIDYVEKSVKENNIYYFIISGDNQIDEDIEITLESKNNVGIWEPIPQSSTTTKNRIIGIKAENNDIYRTKIMAKHKSNQTGRYRLLVGILKTE